MQYVDVRVSEWRAERSEMGGSVPHFHIFFLQMHQGIESWWRVITPIWFCGGNSAIFRVQILKMSHLVSLMLFRYRKARYLAAGSGVSWAFRAAHRVLGRSWGLRFRYLNFLTRRRTPVLRTQCLNKYNGMSWDHGVFLCTWEMCLCVAKARKHKVGVYECLYEQINFQRENFNNIQSISVCVFFLSCAAAVNRVSDEWMKEVK